MPEVGVPPNEKSYLTTAFGTVVYYDRRSSSFRHDDFDKAVLNAPWTGADGNPIIASDWGALTFDQKISTGGAGDFALGRRGLFLSAATSGEIAFKSARVDTWEKFSVVGREKLSRRSWRPAIASGGTEMMSSALRKRMGSEIDKVDLLLNAQGWEKSRDKPAVAWIHNDRDIMPDGFGSPHMVEKVTRFVFVSNWQMQEFITAFALPVDKCLVIKNAIDVGLPGRQWEDGIPWRYRCAYISAPYRGLKTLISAWSEMALDNTDLHIWSSLKLWGGDWNDIEYRDLIAAAKDTRNVFYHGIAPNETIRSALRDMHFLTMPTDFRETFCLAAAEGMAAGCRVVAPYLGALPETTAGFARLYAYNQQSNKDEFKRCLLDEMRNPWGGKTPGMLSGMASYCQSLYDWSARLVEWRDLIGSLT